MKSSLATCLVLLAVLVSPAAALYCYKCHDCGNNAGSSQKCPPGFDSCMTMSIADHTSKACNLKIVCDSLNNPASRDKNLDILNIVKKSFSNVGIDVSEELEELKMECCDGDNCNRATTRLLNPLLFLPTLIFILRF